MKTPLIAKLVSDRRLTERRADAYFRHESFAARSRPDRHLEEAQTEASPGSSVYVGKPAGRRVPGRLELEETRMDSCGEDCMGRIDESVAREPQHLRALEHANRVRLARADLKRRIAAGQMTVPAVVLESPWEARSMELSELLMSQKRWGRERCRRLLLALSIPENKQVGTLTERQREALAAMVSAPPAERRAQAESQPLALHAVAAA
jgi:hypothetical protein